MDGVHLTDRQLERLPGYVVGELDRLAKNLASAREKLAAGPDNSDTFADPYAQSVRPLGKGTRIRFGGLDSNQTFDVQYADGELEITGHRGSQDAMVIVPMVSNSFTVAFARTQCLRAKHDA